MTAEGDWVEMANQPTGLQFITPAEASRERVRLRVVVLTDAPESEGRAEFNVQLGPNLLKFARADGRTTFRT